MLKNAPPDQPKEKPEKAHAILIKHHGGGDPNNATVIFEYREIRETSLP